MDVRTLRLSSESRHWVPGHLPAMGEGLRRVFEQCWVGARLVVLRFLKDYVNRNKGT